MFNGKIKMEKKVSELTRSNLPLSYKPMIPLFLLFMALVLTLLIWYIRRDNIFHILLLTGLGIITSWFTGKWEIQAIKMCLKDGKSPGFKNKLATIPGNKAFIHGLGNTIIFLVIIIIAIIFPEKFSSKLTEFWQETTRDMVLRGLWVVPFADIVMGITYYLFGTIIGRFMPIYKVG
jgi:hypothetical protein